MSHRRHVWVVAFCVFLMAEMGVAQFVPPPPTPALPLRQQLSGAVTADAFGWAAAALGDVDGDGLADYAVGAPDADGNGPSSGTVTVHRGIDGAELYALVGGAAGERAGFALAAVDDLDGDGVRELAVGAPGLPSGRVRVHSGADGALLHVWTGDANLDQFGRSVCGIDDVDGDGVGDVAVGAPSGGLLGEGYVRAFSGASGAALWTVYGGPNPQGSTPLLLGLELAFAEGLGGDGQPDLLASTQIGARMLDPATGLSAGLLDLRAFATGGDVNGDGTDDVIGWSSTAVVVLDGATLLPVFSFPMPAQPFESTGFVGDLNGDGHDEFAAARSASLTTGSAELAFFSGLDGSVLLDFGTFPGELLRGKAMLALGDVDGDGLPDALVSSPVLYLSLGGPGSLIPGHVRIVSRAGRQIFGVPGGPNHTLGLDWERTWVSDPSKGRLIATGPANAPAILLLGLAATVVPFQGVTVHVLTVLPDIHVFVPIAFDGAGLWTTPVNLRDPLLHDTSLYLQVFRGDPSATEGLAASNGLEIHFSR